MMEPFLQFDRQKLKFLTGFLINLCNFEQIYFDYLTLIWLGYLRVFYHFHEQIYSNISKIHFENKIQTIWLLRLTGHILEI